MKKSFMTRALATGLSLAMAFSLSAATNVTTAAAAVKPAMKSSKITVEVGQTKNYHATAATKKAKYTKKNGKKADLFTISAVKISNAAKAELSVKRYANKKYIAVKGIAGTAATRNVIVTFKNAKTNKTTKVTMKATVKEAEKPDEAYKINSATATGVKTITVELNKAVANTASLSAVVKKGTATRESKFTVDGSKIIFAMDAKLIAGTYTVTIEGLETTALTADVNVEKDETLTSFEISDYITAKSFTNTTTGVIKFAALNQYGEKMVSGDPTVSCSFGKVDGSKPSKSASATAEGEIEVTDINPVLAIVGTKGTVVLVGDMGVTATKEITYNSAATAATVEVAGTYHTNAAKMQSIAENDTISDYELLMTVKDQYGYAVSADDLTNLQVSLAGGLTNIKAPASLTFKSRIVDGVEYVAMPLEAQDNSKKAQTGDATLTIVNPQRGLLITTTITVVKNIVITSLNITAENGVYFDQDNELNFEAIDADGKSVTSYAILSNTNVIDLSGNSSALTLKFEKKADGSAKLIFNPAQDPDTQTPDRDKESLPATITVKANTPTGGNYLVKTFTFNVYEKRVAKSVSGIASDTVLAIAKSSTGQLKIGSDKLILADQYSNKVTSADEKVFNKKLYKSTGAAIVGGPSVSGTAVYLATDAAVQADVDTVNNCIVVTPAGVNATVTVYMRYIQAGKTVVTDNKQYEARFTISVKDTEDIGAANLEIKSVNDGFAVTATDAAIDANLKALLKVVAKSGGVDTEIPAGQYSIVKNENNKFTDEEIAKGVDTKTAKVTVQVTTWDPTTKENIETEISKEYQVKRSAPELYKVTKAVRSASTGAISGAAVLDQTDLVTLFEFKNQYGEDVKNIKNGLSTGTAIKYQVVLESTSDDTDSSGCRIVSSGTNKVTIALSKNGDYVLKVVATAPDGSTKDCKLTLQVRSIS